jgi:peroxiredoxin
MLIQPGAIAPDFTLPAVPDESLSLADLRGRRAVLVFYPADFSPVCSDQLALYNEILPDMIRLHASIVGISVDGPWCHRAFAKDRRLRFPLVSDFEPKGQVARRFGAYREHEGVCERAIVVVDEHGEVAWTHLSPIGVNPGADGFLAALERLEATREATP